MHPDHQLSDEAREEFRHALLDETHIATRLQYVSQTLALIINIEEELSRSVDQLFRCLISS
jgi:hypothetical protein